MTATRAVKFYLALLDYATHYLQEYRVIQVGMSGATLYHLRLTAQEAVLKCTDAASGAEAMTRARRELTFCTGLAHQLPLRTPYLLKTYVGAEHVILLTDVYTSSPPYDDEDFKRLGQQLGSLHAAFWNETHLLSGATWLKQPDRTLDEKVSRALVAWQELQLQPQFTDVLETNAWIQPCLNHLPRFHALYDYLPLTLCHGDCHLGNILRDSSGAFVWIDWQDVGLGCGAADVSFLIQRAEMSGVAVPRDIVLTAYYQGLTEAGVQVDEEQIIKGVEVEELKSLSLEWPFYLKQAPKEQVISLLERIHTLAHHLGVLP